MKMLFLGLSAVFLLAAATPAGACFWRAGYAATAGTHYYRAHRYYRHPYAHRLRIRHPAGYMAG
jgi:hypothetical protein